MKRNGELPVLSCAAALEMGREAYLNYDSVAETDTEREECAESAFEALDELQRWHSSVDATAKAWVENPKHLLQIRWHDGKYTAYTIDEHPDADEFHHAGTGPDILTAIARALGLEVP